MKPLYVAMISVHACPIASEEGKETGGLNVYVLELSKALAKRGVTLDLYTRSQSTREEKIKQIAPGVRVIHLPAGPQKPYPKKEIRKHLIQFTNNLLDFIQTESLVYDIIHAHYYLSGLVGLHMKGKLTGDTPLMITFHTLGLLKNLVARSEYETEDQTRIRAEKLLIEKSTHIIANSFSDKEFLLHLYDCPLLNVSVITPGVDTTLFQPMQQLIAKKRIGADLDHFVILAVGRIEPLKGFDVLLYAIKILVSRNPILRGKVCVWIVGGDVSQKRQLWSSELQKLALLRKRLDITAAVRFVGQRPQQQLPAYYSAADVVVMPSHYESFGMVALEAMACGTPVIASDVSGVSHIIGEEFNHMITTANNPLLLAAQLERIILQSKQKETVRNRLRERALSFDWSNIAIQYEKLYRKFQ